MGKVVANAISTLVQHLKPTINKIFSSLDFLGSWGRTLARELPQTLRKYGGCLVEEVGSALFSSFFPSQSLSFLPSHVLLSSFFFSLLLSFSLSFLPSLVLLLFFSLLSFSLFLFSLLFATRMMSVMAQLDAHHTSGGNSVGLTLVAGLDIKGSPSLAFVCNRGSCECPEKYLVATSIALSLIIVVLALHHRLPLSGHVQALLAEENGWGYRHGHQ